ncbi:c-Myc-binding protein [Salvia divinorum]|uniref:c-Myc-binding protein n=1 Tax=Salvia divinorum TaxID=28513 RepID=A0ABD1GPR2_SALDI
MEKEAKKEAFRKYLESSGVLDALTKVLVALYEQNDKPSSATEFIQQKLGGPTLSEYEKLQTEFADLQTRYNELLAVHQEKSRECEELKTTHNQESMSESAEDAQSDKSLRIGAMFPKYPLERGPTGRESSRGRERFQARERKRRWRRLLVARRRTPATAAVLPTVAESGQRGSRQEGRRRRLENIQNS